jgi:hypothetical protein
MDLAVSAGVSTPAIITGAGGAGLYDTNFSNNPHLWKHGPEANWVPYTVKSIRIFIH